MVRGNSNRKGLAELPTGVVCDAMHVLQLGAQLGSYVLQVLDDFGARSICFLPPVASPALLVCHTCLSRPAPAAS